MPKFNPGNLSDKGEYSFSQFLQDKDIALSYLSLLDIDHIEEDDKIERINTYVYLISKGDTLLQDFVYDDQSTLSDSMY